MCKKLAFICLALMLVSTSFAEDLLIGTWENSSDGWKDNGGAAWEAPKYTYSDVGATNGDYALQVAPGSGYQQNLRVDSYQDTLANFRDAWFTHGKFEIDVTYNSADWSAGAGYAQVYELSFQSDSFGWTDVGGANEHTNGGVLNGVVFWDTLNPGYAGGLPMTNAGTPGTILHGTWTWDYSAVLPGGSYSGNKFSNSDGYINIIFSLNSDTAGAYHFDNARLTGIPEPATMTLLGLGGLALLRRKR